MEDKNKANKNQQDVEKELEKYLNNTSDTPQFNFGDSNQQPKKAFDTTKASDLQYFSFDISELPCGAFYPTGTTILIRAAEVKEIQAYSMVDDANLLDVYDKMNEIISTCVKIKYPNGEMGSYLDLKDNDRFYLVFVIRDLTFQKANALNLDVTCEHCKAANKISLNKNSFLFYKMEECSLVKDYFDNYAKMFVFESNSNKTYRLGIPTIGLQKSFFTYIVNNSQTPEKNKELNSSFLKIMPYTISDRKSITEEGIKKLFLDFQSLSNDEFQFLNAAVEDIQFGIKNVITECVECHEEVHSEFTFPNGASGLFVLEKSKAFEGFLKPKQYNN